MKAPTLLRVLSSRCCSPLFVAPVKTKAKLCTCGYDTEMCHLEFMGKCILTPKCLIQHYRLTHIMMTDAPSIYLMTLQQNPIKNIPWHYNLQKNFQRLDWFNSMMKLLYYYAVPVPITYINVYILILILILLWNHVESTWSYSMRIRIIVYRHVTMIMGSIIDYMHTLTRTDTTRLIVIEPSASSRNALDTI